MYSMKHRAASRGIKTIKTKIERSNKQISDLVEAYAEENGSEDEPLEQNLTDILADILHYAASEGLSTEDIMRQAVDHFTYEVTNPNEEA